MKNVGAEIKRIRTMKGLSVRGLAEVIGRSTGYVSELESGKRNPTPDILAKLSESIGLVIESECPVETRFAQLQVTFESGECVIEDCITESELIVSELTKTSQSSKILGDAYLLLSDLYRRKEPGRSSNSIRYAILAQDVFSKNGDSLRWCESLFSIAQSDSESGNFEHALERLYLVERKLVTLNYSGFLSTKVCAAIALTAANLEMVEVMSNYVIRCEEGIEYVPANKRDRFRATNEYLWGKSLEEQGSFYDALDSYKNAHMRYKDINDNANALVMLHNCAEVYLKMEKLEEAVSKAAELVTLKESHGCSLTSIGITKILIGRIKLKQGLYEDGIRYLNEVVNCPAVEPRERLRALIQLISAYKELDNPLLTNSTSFAVIEFAKEHDLLNTPDVVAIMSDLLLSSKPHILGHIKTPA